ncbi:MAG: hypothetical protein Q8N44_04460 [Rubrivivax sp.]|nr:hypothetical protein [Rubrivivax sp.]
MRRPIEPICLLRAVQWLLDNESMGTPHSGATSLSAVVDDTGRIMTLRDSGADSRLRL